MFKFIEKDDIILDVHSNTNALFRTDHEWFLDAAIHEKLLIVSSRSNELVFVTSLWVVLVNIY
jgi:hypothetical protein